MFMQTFMERIEVYSQPGQGTTVLLHKTLPAGEQKIDEVG